MREDDAISRSAVLEMLTEEFDYAKDAATRTNDDNNCANYIGKMSCANRAMLNVMELPALNVVPAYRLGEFGSLFQDYKGCPRGASGRACMPLEEEVLQMKPLTDVDGMEWIPVNADALRELVREYVDMRKKSGWISVRDRLPENGEAVLTYKNGIVEAQVYEKKKRMD